MPNGTKQIKITGLNGYALTYRDDSDEENPVYKAIDLTSKLDNIGTATLAMDDLVDESGNPLVNDKDEVRLYRAWTVAPSSPTGWKAYAKCDEKGVVGVEATNSDPVYIPVKGTEAEKTIYIQEQGNMILTTKDGTTPLVWTCLDLARPFGLIL